MSNNIVNVLFLYTDGKSSMQLNLVLEALITSHTEICHVCEKSYTAKNYDLFKVVENRMQQCCAAYIVHSCQCQQYCSALLSLNQPAIRCNNAEQYC